jgi:ligand-binding SRPBCC domain-containing protein
MSAVKTSILAGGINRLTRRQILPAPIGQVWEFFSAPENLNEITPPDLSFEILSGGAETMYSGQLIEYRIQFLPPFQSRWLTEITHVDEPNRFVDEQRLGPYKFWHHQHRFKEVESGTEMIDQVTYQLPFGILGDLVHTLWIKRRLERIFDFRAEQVGQIFSP